MITFKTILVVAAHPDDEVLGCGGTLARLASEGVETHVALLADGVGSRYGTRQRIDGTALSAELEARRAAAREAARILGVRSVSFGDFPDNRMDVVPLLDIIQKIESLIDAIQPDTVFTHHPGDVNVDHRRIHEAITAACRPQPGSCVRTILCFEVPSSTEWQLPAGGPPFAPNCHVALSPCDLEKKRNALACYAHEMRPWPHPRSLEAIETLTRLRGAQAGVDASEAFMIVRALVPESRNPPPGQ